MGNVIIGYDKDGKDHAQYINLSGWSSLLCLGRLYGWKPEGTKLIKWTHNKTGEKFLEEYLPYPVEECTWGYDEDWDGAYDSNDWQIISPEDASNFATALEELLSDLPYNAECFECRAKDLDEETREKIRRKIQGWSDPRCIELLTNIIAILQVGKCRIF